MKKFLALSTVAMLSTAGASEYRSGAYVGLQVGYGNFNAKANDTLVFLDTGVELFAQANTSANKPLNGSASKGAFSFGALLGYTHVMESNLVVGAELSFSKNTGEVSVANTQTYTPVVAVPPFNIQSINSTTNIKHSFSFAPTLLIGYKFTHQLMAALKIGANISRFDVTNNYVANFANPAANLVSSDSTKFTKTGLDVGIRAEYMLTDNIAVTGDVTYTYFGDSTITLSDPTLRNGVSQSQGSTHTVTIKPRFITARLGASYRF